MRRFHPLILIAIVAVLIGVGLLIQVIRAKECFDRGGISVGPSSGSQRCAEP